MSILRSEVVVALNDVIMACREAAIHHETAADACSVEKLQRALEALSRDRRAAFDELSEKVNDLGDAPNAPAHEKELLDSAVTRVKAALSTDEIIALLDGCESKESRIAEAARVTIRHTDDASLRSRLEELRDDATSRIPALRQEFDES